MAAALLWSASRPAAAAPTADLHDELTSVQEVAPIVWLAADERLYPVLPHAFAFDSLDNDNDGFLDLQDPKEIAMGEKDIATSSALVEDLRGLGFSEGLNLPANQLTTAAPASQKSLQIQQVAIDIHELRSATLSDTIRAVFRRRGILLSPWCDWEHTGRDTFTLTEHWRWLTLPGEHLTPDRDSWDALGRTLVDKLGREYSGYVVACDGGGCRFRSRVDPGKNVSFALREDKDTLGVYAGSRVYSVTASAQDRCVRVRRESRMPRPRVSYHVDTTDVRRDLDLVQFWFYYLFDVGKGGHLHDNEQLFVHVLGPREVVGVVAGAHTSASANNVLVRGRQARVDVQLPRELPRHMPVLVELGKHASAPDRDFNGKFDIGSDANVFYSAVWGTRDIPAAFGIDILRQAQPEFSFPREMNSLVLEKHWYQAAELGDARLRQKDAPYYASLTSLDRDYLLRVGPPSSRDGIKAYELFPVSDMQALMACLNGAIPDSVALVRVEDFLRAHRECFWGENLAPEAIVIAPAAFQAMREWAKKPEAKRDAWEHRLYKRPGEIFKLWLFPKVALNLAPMLTSSGAVGRVGIQVSEMFGVKVSTLEAYVDYEERAKKLRDVGIVKNMFRGSHHGWFYGFGWKASDDDWRNTVITIGLMPVGWDPRSLPGVGGVMWHGQIAIRTSVRGELHWYRRAPWNLDPLQFQVGLQLGIPLKGPRHPLDY